VEKEFEWDHPVGTKDIDVQVRGRSVVGRDYKLCWNARDGISRNWGEPLTAERSTCKRAMLNVQMLVTVEERSVTRTVCGSIEIDKVSIVYITQITRFFA
jgi:hypothetical protein